MICDTLGGNIVVEIHNAAGQICASVSVNTGSYSCNPFSLTATLTSSGACIVAPTCQGTIGVTITA
jgi:hypothetical protein